MRSTWAIYHWTPYYFLKVPTQVIWISIDLKRSEIAWATVLPWAMVRVVYMNGTTADISFSSHLWFRQRNISYGVWLLVSHDHSHFVAGGGLSFLDYVSSRGEKIKLLQAMEDNNRWTSQMTNLFINNVCRVLVITQQLKMSLQPVNAGPRN